MNWQKTEIITENNEKVLAQVPVIVSASRSTDVPAFYADWFINRLKAGYIKWKNPFSGVPLYVSFKKTRIIVFWSKNPKQIIKHLDYIDETGINYYFQFTLNDYEKEGLEKKVGTVDKRIDTFIELSEKIGKEKVIWRFDPYILTDELGVDELLKRTEYIGDKLKNYTEKLVFSFADIQIYKKVQKNMQNASVKYIEFTEKSMNEIAEGLMKLNKNWEFEIGTCAEKIDLDKFGIIHNKCIDDELMVKLFSKDKALMEFIGYEMEEYQTSIFDNGKTNNQRYKYKIKKDKGQRELCGCIMSKDIGQYNTCPHECIYCYANTSIETAKRNYERHKLNPNSETIIGE
jgi:DNA repair photolyase